MPRTNATSQDFRVKLSDGRWLSYGQYGDPLGRPVVYMHGGLSSRLDIAFADSICKLKGVRLIAPDRPGMGLSDRKPSRNMQDWSRDIAELALALELAPFATFGWSLGGPYALVCAHDLPHLVTRAGTIGGVAPFERPRAENEQSSIVDHMILSATGPAKHPAAIALTLARCMPRPLIRWSLLLESKSAVDREIIAAMSSKESTDFLYEGTRQGGKGIMDDYASVGGYWGFDLPNIKQKVFIWHGESDLICPRSGAEYLNRLIPHSNLEIVPSLGHFLHHRKLDHILDTLLANK